MPFFHRKSRAWITPGGNIWTLYHEMSKQPHLLIAGATGSGKSVLVRGIIHTLLHDSPAKVRFILIDPKQVELNQYEKLPHTLMYADQARTMLQAIQYAKQITDQRFSEMKKQRLTEYNGSDVYVIIDALDAIMTTQKHAVLPILQYLGMYARPAHVHMIACTQTVNADVLPTTLTCNFDSRVALRTSTAQQSRMIIDRAGCETFPSPCSANEAHCYFRTGASLERWKLPFVSDEEIDQLISWWTSDRCKA